MDEPEPKRLRFTKTQLEEMTKEDIIDNWMKQDNYVDVLEAKAVDGQKESSELVSLRESEEKMKQQQSEATRRENVLVMRLTTKEQEMQEYANQIQELKQAQIPGTSLLRSTLLDPAVNLMFERMKKELELMKAKLEETQNDLSAWKFTPDSNTGKRLMAKCRLLHQENEELGKIISSGRVAKLEGDLALQRNFSEEMKKSQAELDEFLMELDEDVEGMQSTIYYLQQQLRESKETIAKLQKEVDSSKAPAMTMEQKVSERHPSPDVCLMDFSERSVHTENSNFTDNDDSNDHRAKTPEVLVNDLVLVDKRTSPSPTSAINHESPKTNGDLDHVHSPQFRTSVVEDMEAMDSFSPNDQANHDFCGASPSDGEHLDECRTPSPSNSPATPLTAPSSSRPSGSPTLPTETTLAANNENGPTTAVDSDDNKNVHEDESHIVAQIHSPHTPPDPPPFMLSQEDTRLGTPCKQDDTDLQEERHTNLNNLSSAEDSSLSNDGKSEKDEMTGRKQSDVPNGVVESTSACISDDDVDI